VFGPQNKWRPFCSERCKTLDLGDWAAERYRVASEEKLADSPEKGSEQISSESPPKNEAP
jgi:endogenous inhibitor of DNA gyrase (YacG/DUF329 family)